MINKQDSNAQTKVQSSSIIFKNQMSTENFLKVQMPGSWLLRESRETNFILVKDGCRKKLSLSMNEIIKVGEAAGSNNLSIKAYCSFPAVC